MQGFRSRSGSSEIQPRNSLSSPSSKRSPSPKVARSSSASSDSSDSRVSRLCDRKPSPMSQSLQEKQRIMRISDMQQQLGKVLEDMKKAKEERSQALQELAELKKKNEGSTQSNHRITMLELEVEKAKESEMKLLESLISQTKQLEQTKILLEEANLEIRNLREIPVASEKKGLLASVQTIQAQEEIRNLRNELRLALQAEEKSKKAMDDFAIAIKEVTTEITLAKDELYATKSELKNVREEAEHAKSSLQNTEQKLREAMDGYHKLKLEYEDSAAVWKAKEDGFINCIKVSEEDIEKKEEENSKLVEAHQAAKEDTSKLRDIIKQAVNEAMMVKESLAIARNENSELKEQLSEKESELHKIKLEYENLKASEKAAINGARGIYNIPSSSTNASNFQELEPFGPAKSTGDDRKISKNLKKFPSDRWDGPRIQNGNRRSAGDSDMLKSMAFDKERALENHHDRRLKAEDLDHFEGMLYHDAEGDKQKKKKTVFGRFGDALRRRSFRKT